MARPSLPIGAHGNITTRVITPPGQRTKVWEAKCRYRDADGGTRQVRRTAGSRSAAENELRSALAERRHAGGDTLTPDSRLSDAWVLWSQQRAAEVEGGQLAASTMGVYASAWKLHLGPNLGGLRLREVSVSRCEAWQQALRKRRGPSSTKTARAVLSGVLGYAARMGAIPTNPVRDLSVIPGGRKRTPRAMTHGERAAWIAAMEDDAKAARWDVPDLTRFMLATGARIGEALAVTWDEVDLDAGTVAIRWHLVRVTGAGLNRVEGAKSDAGDRLLRVPRWCVDMLMARRVDPRSGWPVFPDSLGGWRDPSNMLRVFRQARDAAGFGWVTSHVFRKTSLTALDGKKLTAREIADVAGHADPSMTQRVYMGRGVASDAAADALEDLL